MKKMRFREIAALCIALALAISIQASPKGQRQQPPEYKEVVAAVR